MADVTVTAASVRALGGAITRRKQAGGTLAPGSLVYLNSSGYIVAADADAAASTVIYGVVVSGPNGATTISSGDWCDVVVFGPVTGFSSLTPGGYVFASVTAGKIADAAPAGSSSDYVGVVGIVEDSTTILVNPFTYDVAAQ